MKMLLRSAQSSACCVMRKLGPHCSRISESGEARRRCPLVSKIVLVLIPKPGIEPLRSLRDEIQKIGKPDPVWPAPCVRIRAAYPVEIHTVTAEQWGWVLLETTGPKGFVDRLKALWCVPGRGRYVSGNRLYGPEEIPTPDEIDVAVTIGVLMPAPAKRT